MRTAREIMDEAKTRYRHTYGDKFVIGLLNEVIKDIWKKVPRESLPATIICDKSEMYPIPSGIRRRNIKRVSFGRMTGPFKTLTPIEVGETVSFGCYVLMENFIIIKEDPDNPDTFLMMVYYDRVDPVLVDESNLDDPLDLDTTYEEAAIFGLLERIAASRKDVKMKNNFASDYNLQIGDIMIEAVDKDPDYPSCKDELPRRARYHYGGTMDY